MTWLDASVPPPPALQSKPAGTGEYNMLLLAIPGETHARIGWYLAGLQEWRVEGSNNPVRPTHYMPLPKLPA